MVEGYSKQHITTKEIVMIQFFVKDYTGAPFQFFGLPHIIALLLVILFNVLLVRLLKNSPGKIKRKIAYILAAILWVNEMGWHFWNYFTGQWTIQTMLPLHLCSLLVWTGALMLVTKNYAIYEFCYFLGVGGALQALLTPDLGIYGYPHYRFFQTYISHGLIITAAIYMTLVEGFRPTWKSILRVALWMNIYLGVVYVINMLIGSNYLFIAHKPQTASLLDILPPWPWYILWMEVIGLVICLVLFFPIAISNWRSSLIEKRNNAVRLDQVTK